MKIILKNSLVKERYIFKTRSLKEMTMIVESMHSNLPVAQNWRIVIYPVYPGGGTMVAKILDFRLSGSLKCALQDLLLSQITPRKLNFALSLRELS